MRARRSAFLFPGHTARDVVLPPGFPTASVVTSEVFDIVDGVAEKHGLPAVTPGETEYMATPTMRELVLFAVSVAVHTMLHERGIRPTVLLGHSLGSLAALTCASAFSIADGARMLCARARVFDRLPADEQGMTALALSAPAARRLVAAVGDPELVVACHNAADRTVLCGPRESLAAAESAGSVVGSRSEADRGVVESKVVLVELEPSSTGPS